MSSGTNSERITQNNGIITDNNTAIDNFKTAITNLPTRAVTQTKSVTITENGTTTVEPDTGYDGLSEVEIVTSVGNPINDLKDLMDDYKAKLSNVIDKLLNEVEYEPYFNEAKTIYGPGDDYKYFVIVKRPGSPSPYVIDWLNFDFIGKLNGTSGTREMTLAYSINTNYNCDLRNSSISGTFNGNALGNLIKRSDDFNSLNSLLEAISSPTGDITYSSSSSHSGPNINYNNRLIITNVPIIDSDGSLLQENVYSFSDDLTILSLPEA